MEIASELMYSIDSVMIRTSLQYIAKLQWWKVQEQRGDIRKCRDAYIFMRPVAVIELESANIAWTFGISNNCNEDWKFSNGLKSKLK